jgi:hypothetical protein
MSLTMTSPELQDALVLSGDSASLEQTHRAGMEWSPFPAEAIAAYLPISRALEASFAPDVPEPEDRR